jgi:hypothetical protein
MTIKLGDLITSFSKRQSSRYFLTIVVDGGPNSVSPPYVCTGWRLGAPGTRMFITGDQACRGVITFGGLVSDRSLKCCND